MGFWVADIMNAMILEFRLMWFQLVWTNCNNYWFKKDYQVWVWPCRKYRKPTIICIHHESKINRFSYHRSADARLIAWLIEHLIDKNVLQLYFFAIGKWEKVKVFRLQIDICHIGIFASAMPVVSITPCTVICQRLTL